MEVERKIRKIGNSLGVYIPPVMLEQMGLKYGDTVYLSLEDGELVIRSEPQKQKNDEFKEKVVSIIEEYMKENERSR